MKLIRLGQHLETAARRLVGDATRPTTHEPWCGYVVFGKACTCGWSANPTVEHRGAGE